MKRYLRLQIKREFKIFPFVLIVAFTMFMALGLIFSGMLKNLANKEENQRFKVGLSGDTDNTYLNMGLSFVRTMDNTRYTIDIKKMSESEAERALDKGEISAYVVLPEDFMEKVLRGENTTIQYVTSPGNGGVITLFKNEITKLVTEVVIGSQKGTYGIEEAAYQVGLGRKAGNYMDQISVEYVELILKRTALHEVQSLGISGGTTMVEAIACGIAVMFLMLMGLPYIVIHTKKDRAFNRLLVSKRHSVWAQMGCECCSNFLAMIFLAIMILGIVSWGGKGFGFIVNDNISTMFTMMVPIVLMFTAFNLLLFEIASDIISGILLHFFVTISLSYVSGCMYPITAFPKVVQKIMSFTPTGLARDGLTTCFTSESPMSYVYGMLIYSFVFWCLAVVVRKQKIKHARG